MLRVRKLMDLATNGAARKGSDRVMVLTEPAPMVIAKARNACRSDHSCPKEVLKRIPRVTTGNTRAPCVLIGERAGEILKADNKL
jgi:hypothetical protein